MSEETSRIWLIIGDKLGDNAQVEVLAEKLGLPTERKELRFKERWVRGKPPFRASLYHIDLERSAALEPPWPDLIITIGRRPAMAALWVKRRSGGRTKIVLIGRPKRYFNEFDLVIATGQYRVPDRPNVLKLDLPLMRADPEAVARAASEWQARLADLPRPLTAVFVGGATKPFRFEPGDARELLHKVRAATGDTGSLYISTSRRTSAAAAEALQEALPANAQMFRWKSDASAPENPYLALLGTADRFVVTGDSISMMVEVARLGRPLAIARLPVRGGIGAALVGVPQRLLQMFLPLERLERGLKWPLLQSRDFEGFYRNLRRVGGATFLDEGFPAVARLSPTHGTGLSARIRSLLSG